jgi:hypothetical protein
MEPQPRMYEVHWTSGETSVVLALSRQLAREAALVIYAGSRTKTAVDHVVPLQPTAAERRMAVA